MPNEKEALARARSRQKLFPAAQRALLPGALLYGYLLRIEDRQTYQCLASYSKIGKAIGRSINTVRKYVSELEERSLIRTERTTIITQDKCPIRCVLMVFGHFRIWVRIWVSRNCK